MPAQKYLWNDLFAKPKFRLRRGRDFDCSMSSMAQQIRTNASRHHVGVSISEAGEELIVEVHKEGAGASTK